eukprot:5589643-Alexandrium_andersonii.AAC.1
MLKSCGSAATADAARALTPALKKAPSARRTAASTRELKTWSFSRPSASTHRPSVMPTWPRGGSTPPPILWATRSPSLTTATMSTR